MYHYRSLEVQECQSVYVSQFCDAPLLQYRGKVMPKCILRYAKQQYAPLLCKLKFYSYWLGELDISIQTTYRLESLFGDIID